VGYSVNSISKKQTKTKTSQYKKSIAREVGVALAGLSIGKDNARLAYRAGAKGMKMVRKAVVQSKTKKKKPSLVSNFNRQPHSYSVASQSGLILSKPSSLYLRSFINPFDSSVKSVGIPKPGALPSFKVTGFVRGSGVIGISGIGFVYLAPTLCNNVACVGYTTSAYSNSFVAAFGSNEPAGSPIGDAVSPAGLSMTNLPFDWTVLTQSTDPRLNIEGRIVSSSLRVYYTGTKLNQSGQYFAYADPDFAQVQGPQHVLGAVPAYGFSPSTLGQKDSTEISAVGDNEIRLICVPPAETFSDYPLRGASAMRQTFPYASNVVNGPSACGAAIAVIVVTGVAGQPFYFEAITHAEYVGPGVMQSLLTPSNTDAIGYDAIQMLLARSQRRTATDARTNLSRCIRDEMMNEGIRMS